MMIIVRRYFFCFYIFWALAITTGVFAANKNTLATHLSQAIQFQTSSNGKKQAFIQFNRWLEVTYPLSFKILSVKKFKNARLLTWQGRSKKQLPILLAAHMDVVPATADGWCYQPFSGKIINHEVWGRGALDDKHSVIMILEAVESLLKSNYQPNRTIYIALGADEETQGHGARAMAAYLEKEGVMLEMVLDEGSQIVEKLLPQVQKPIAFIGIAEKGSVDMQLVFHGKGGHASRPPKNSAIRKLSQIMQKIDADILPYRLTSSVVKTFTSLAPSANMPSSILFKYPRLFKWIIISRLKKSDDIRPALQTTIAMTQVAAGTKNNVIPKRAALGLNIRLLPGDTSHRVLAVLKKVFRKQAPDISIVGQASEPVTDSSVTSEVYRKLKTVIESVRADYPLLIVPSLVTAQTDSRHYRRVSKAIYRFIYVSGRMNDFSGIHGINEHVSTDNLLHLYRFYRKLLVSF